VFKRCCQQACSDLRHRIRRRSLYRGVLPWLSGPPRLSPAASVSTLAWWLL